MTPSNAQQALDALNDAENNLLRMSLGYHVDGTLPMNYTEWVGHCLKTHLPAIRQALQRELSGGWNTNMEEAPRDGTDFIGRKGIFVFLTSYDEEENIFYTVNQFYERSNYAERTGKAVWEPECWQHLPPPKDEKK
jgi:hypothetical protein